jgi:hypothetical protein
MPARKAGNASKMASAATMSGKYRDFGKDAMNAFRR